MRSRTAVVTGGSRGIGLEIARTLLAGGYAVVVTGRKPDGLEAALRELGQPTRLAAVAGDTADAEHHANVVETALDRFGSLDLLVANAGINPHYGELLAAEPAVIRRIFDANVVATIGWIRAAYCSWMAEHGGSVVVISSAAGLRPARLIGAYGASKATLIHVTQQLALELAPRIRVNAIAPAVVRTRFAEKLYLDEEGVAARYPMGRIGAPQDVAAAVRFLASDEAGWITGQTLVVDGGLLTSGGIEE